MTTKTKSEDVLARLDDRGPPRLLDTPAHGDYRTRVDDAVRGGSAIARADLADAVLRVLPDPGTYRHTVDVAY